MSFTEVVVLLLLAIVVVGPRQLPGMLRSAGRFLGQARRWLLDMRSQSGIDDILRMEGIERDLRELRSLVKGNVVEALTVELDQEGHKGTGGTSSNSIPLEVGRQSTEQEYPLVGCDSYGAVAEDVDPYVPENESSTVDG